MIPTRERTEYKLLRTKELDKLAEISYRLGCFAKHLQITKDITGHIFPFIDCFNCNQASRCQKLIKIMEQELNGG